MNKKIVSRDKNGKLYFSDMNFTIMLDGMLGECNSCKEIKFLVECIRDCVENFCEVIEEGLEDC